MKTTGSTTSKALTKAIEGLNVMYKTEYRIEKGYKYRAFSSWQYCGSGNNPKWLADCIPAYTMFELWNMLPKKIIMDYGNVYQRTIRQEYEWTVCCYQAFGTFDILIQKKDNRAENALAELVIWCIENKFKVNLTTD